jgi:hypothetical protein
MAPGAEWDWAKRVTTSPYQRSASAYFLRTNAIRPRAENWNKLQQST